MNHDTPAQGASSAPLTPVSGGQATADYFDGVHARAVPVALRVDGDELVAEGPALALRLPLSQVRWPERTRHGARIAQLHGGGSLHAHDTARWDQWARAHRLGEGWVVSAQQSWRGAVWALATLVLLGVAGYWWGVPAASRAVVALTPLAVDERVGQLALDALEGRWLQPSRLPAQEQDRLRQLFDRAARTAGSPVRYTVTFRRSRIGPNALALPGGTLVITDELVELLDGHEEALVGVFGHELGHVEHRHTMKMLVQSSLLGAAAGAVLGDFSTVLAGVPALVGQLAYSRDAEREADDSAIALLRANHVRPSTMVILFERLGAPRSEQAAPDTSGPGIAFSSHPAHEERIARFRQADHGP